jgi:hypothetical protein
VKLITGAVGRLAADKGVGRAEALRQSMLALIDKGNANEAHPSYWAPFVVWWVKGPPRSNANVGKCEAQPEGSARRRILLVWVKAARTLRTTRHLNKERFLTSRLLVCRNRVFGQDLPDPL